MSNFSELASTRRSIRKYQEKDIALHEIEELIKVAVTAPSGCNSQCWKFVAIKDKDTVKQIEDAVLEKVFQLLDQTKEKVSEQYLESKKKMVSFFTKAPVVVAVFMTKLDFNDPVYETAVKDGGCSQEEFMKFLAYPDLLSIGAAIQNLLLAAHEKGFGACWMNDPAVAGEEIREILKLPHGYRFISLIPIGYPAYQPRDKKMKAFDEVYSEI